MTSWLKSWKFFDVNIYGALIYRQSQEIFKKACVASFFKNFGDF